MEESWLLAVCSISSRVMVLTARWPFWADSMACRMMKGVVGDEMAMSPPSLLAPFVSLDDPFLLADPRLRRSAQRIRWKKALTPIATTGRDECRTACPGKRKKGSDLGQSIWARPGLLQEGRGKSWTPDANNRWLEIEG